MKLVCDSIGNKKLTVRAGRLRTRLDASRPEIEIPDGETVEVTESPTGSRFADALLFAAYGIAVSQKTEGEPTFYASARFVANGEVRLCADPFLSVEGADATIFVPSSTRRAYLAGWIVAAILLLAGAVASIAIGVLIGDRTVLYLGIALAVLTAIFVPLMIVRSLRRNGDIAKFLFRRYGKIEGAVRKETEDTKDVDV